jgi:carboxylate-amine ligase
VSAGRIDFAGSSRPTLGVEWEFALVDADSRDLSNEAAAVIAEIGDNSRVHKELLRNTIELVTGVCDTVAEAMDDLSATLAATDEVVRERGMELFCAGTHPFAQWSAQKLTDAPRYAELIKRTQWWGRQMLIWGVHVHVGVSSAHKVMPIISSLLNQYPHLLALSASSPFWAGEDTGYASNRAMMFQQLPTAGLPFQFETWRQFERFVHDQRTTGIIDQINEIRWDVRPSPNLGTVEVRVFDGVSNLRELSALVGRGATAGDAALACPGEQMAGGPLRTGRHHHPRCRQQRTSCHRRPRRSADPACPGGRVAALRRRTGRCRRDSQGWGVLSAAAPRCRGP